MTDLDFVGPLSVPAQGNLDVTDLDFAASVPTQGNFLGVRDLDFVGSLSAPMQGNLNVTGLNFVGPLASASVWPNPLEQHEPIVLEQIRQDLNCKTLINSLS